MSIRLSIPVSIALVAAASITTLTPSVSADTQVTCATAQLVLVQNKKKDDTSKEYSVASAQGCGDVKDEKPFKVKVKELTKRPSKEKVKDAEFICERHEALTVAGVKTGFHKFEGCLPGIKS